MRDHGTAEVVLVETLSSCRVALEREGISADELAARAGMEVGLLENSRNRMSWQQFVDAMGFTSEVLGGPAAMRRLGHSVEKDVFSLKLARALRALISPRRMYQAIARWIWPMLWPDLELRLEVVGPTTLVLRTAIPDELRACPAWFHMAHGVLERAPCVLGFLPSVVDLELDEEGRKGHFLVAHAPSVSIFTWMRIVVRSILTPSAVIEHQTAHVAELNDKLHALVEARRAVEDALEVEERFLTNISHELRTPLTAAVGLVDMIGTDEDPDGLKNEVQAAHHELLRKIELLIDYSQLVRGQLSLARERFRLETLFEGLDIDFEQAALQKGLELHVQLSHLGEAGTRYGDAPRLRRVLHELVRNALTFTEAGRVDVEGRWTGEAIEITVRDTGPGMSEELRSQALQAFRQADDSLTRRHEGLGLGLPLSVGLVRSMEGKIEIESMEGARSCITVVVPLPPTPQAPLRSSRGCQKVLVVDDNRLNRRILSRLLARVGFEVAEAEDGVEALAVVAAERPGLVLMDCQMPNMDGFEATRRLRETEAGA